MRILFISPTSPFEGIGGIERYLTNLLNYAKLIPDQNIYLLTNTTKEERVEKLGNITIYHTKCMILSASQETQQREVSKKAQQFSATVTDIITKQSIEIICAENFHIAAPAAFNILLHQAAGLNKVPVVLQLHSFARSEIERELVNQLLWSKIICVSKSVVGDCFRKGADIDLLKTSYLGVDVSEFNTTITSAETLKSSLGLSESTKIVMTASRILLGHNHILKEKGIINLIQAFSKISPRYPELRLLIAVGRTTADWKNEFEAALLMLRGYLKLNNVESRTIVRQFELDEMPSVYRGADIFALPSENETFGQVFIEAMASGLPVIGTNVGGIPEIISDGYNGFLVTPDDTTMLGQRLELLLKDNDLREQFSDRGLRTVEANFTASKQLASFFALLQSVLSNPTSA